MVNNPRLSNNALTEDVPLTFYENSPELTDLNPKHVRVIRGNVVSNKYFASDNLSTGEFPGGSVFDGASEEVVETPEDPVVTGNKSPSLGDISVLLNTIVYDAAGNPSATVVFRVKNSSGLALKGVNARVSIP